MSSDYERLGGEEGLRSILDDLVQRMAADFVIGWLFEGRDLQHIARQEVSFAAAHLGGPRAYEGRPLPRVHQPLPINRGMFHRRLALLRTVLREHGVDEGVIERWLAHDARLEASLTDGTDCAPPAAP
jgi:hemoglobin